MLSAVLILPADLRAAGNAVGAAMSWGPESYTIPLSPTGSGAPTHYGLRADVSDEFVAMLAAARAGIYPPGVPPSALAPVLAALVADYSSALWGVDHLDAVLSANGLMRAA